MASDCSRRVSADEVRARAAALGLSLERDADASNALDEGGLGGRWHIIAFAAGFLDSRPVFTVRKAAAIPPP